MNTVSIPATGAADPLLAAVREHIPDFTIEDLTKVPRVAYFIDERNIRWESGKRSPLPQPPKRDASVSDDEFAALCNETALNVFDIFLYEDEDRHVIYATPAEGSQSNPVRFTLRGKKLTAQVFLSEEAFTEALAADVARLISPEDPTSEEEDDEEDTGLDDARAELKAAADDAKLLNETFNRAPEKDKDVRMIADHARTKAGKRLIDAIAEWIEEVDLDEAARLEASSDSESEETSNGSSEAPEPITTATSDAPAAPASSAAS